MNSTAIRLALAAAALWLVLGGGGGSVVPSVAPYSGSMTNLHQASREMPAADRAALSGALDAAGKMLASDSKGLVATTAAMQKFVTAVLEFDYVGVGKPSAKYPSAASALQSEMQRALGSDVGPVDSAVRSRMVSALTEAALAVR